MDSEALARRIAAVAENKGATDRVAIDVSELLGYTDYLVICTARNERQATPEVSGPARRSTIWSVAAVRAEPARLVTVGGTLRGSWDSG